MKKSALRPSVPAHHHGKDVSPGAQHGQPVGAGKPHRQADATAGVLAPGQEDERIPVTLQYSTLSGCASGWRILPADPVLTSPTAVQAAGVQASTQLAGRAQITPAPDTRSPRAGPPQPACAPKDKRRDKTEDHDGRETASSSPADPDLGRAQRKPNHLVIGFNFRRN
jgi:hypothetical protein